MLVGEGGHCQGKGNRFVKGRGDSVGAPPLGPQSAREAVADGHVDNLPELTAMDIVLHVVNGRGSATEKARSGGLCHSCGGVPTEPKGFEGGIFRSTWERLESG